MPKKTISGHQQELFDLLLAVTGHLKPASPKEERSIHSLQETLAGVLFREDISQVKDGFFSVEGSDLFFPDTVAPKELTRLRNLAGRTVREAAEPDLRLFVRDVPVWSTQIKGSVPLWAGGAAVEKTVGPFVNKDGRKIWFDFYRIEKLVALFNAGQPDPAILFNVSLRKKFVNKALPPVVSPAVRYKLAPGSVWLNSRILTLNAPVGAFTGLKIKGGEITLSAPPQVSGGKLTIAPGTVVTVKLDLVQPAVAGADPASPYGVDARDATLDLPKQITFHFSGSGGHIDKIGGEPQWKVYGHADKFKWNSKTAPTYDVVLNRILIPFTCSEKTFAVRSCKSPFTTFAGAADIQRAAWALPTAQIDVTKPSPAAGIGGMAIQCKKGLTAKWAGLQGGDINLTNPYVLCDVDGVDVTGLQAGNLSCSQEYKLWKDDVNPFGSSVKLQYTAVFPFVYLTVANGNEALLALANTNPLLDRPVTVTGQPFDLHSKNSLLILAVNKAFKLIYLYDDNILFDNYDPNKPIETLPTPLAIALHNALFKVTPVNGCLLFGLLADDMVTVERGAVFLTNGIYAYLPTLPDPYAANLAGLRFQFGRGTVLGNTAISGQTVWLWLVCQILWQPLTPDKDNVDVSFHFAPLQNQFQILAAAGQPAVQTPQPDVSSHPFVKLFTAHDDTSAGAAATVNAFSAATPGEMKPMMAVQIPDLQAQWDKAFSYYQNDLFALLDVSSNANQMGVSFGSFGGERTILLRTFDVVAKEQAVPATEFPLQVEGLDVGARGLFVRAFTVPQISWEPVLNLTDPKVINPTDPAIEPPLGPNYYPNDGGPTRIFNNSVQFVPMAPIPLANAIVDRFEHEKGNITASLFTLPFGMRAIAVLNKDTEPAHPPTIEHNSHLFPDDLKGGIQLQFNAGKLPFDDFPLFHGGTLQINNILNISGQKTLTSTLGDSVTFIFNKEFQPKLADLLKSRGVPLTRIDFSGYGASTLSSWFNPGAQFAQTSQARFDVFVGRTAHEVIQVRSIVYPWAIRVVRTIILYRAGSGYVFRVDTGWKAESDGRFDYSYRLKDPNNPNATVDISTEKVFKFHPGVVKGLFNVKNIVEVGDKVPLKTTVFKDGYYVDENNNTKIAASDFTEDAMVKMVQFDADVEIEDAVQGAVNGRVPSKGIMGYVQLAPMGIPLSPDALENLITYQFGAIGGPIDCLVDIAKNGQKMRLNRFDVNNARDESGAVRLFVAAGRGNVVLPKEGAWSMVMHQHATGEVTPVPTGTTLPLIRIGQLTKTGGTLKTIEDPDKELLRIANPTEIVRQAMNQTINFGFLQTTDTQKALFLTPAFAKLLDAKKTGTLLSKTPPLFADAYRLISSKGIFPNIGDAVNSFGDAIALTKDFTKDVITDGGQQVWKLMQINMKDAGGKLLQEGYKLANAVKSFDLPNTEWYLINEDYLKIYVEYKTTKKTNGSTDTTDGKLNFDVDSFAGGLADQWKSRMNNVSMALDLGPFKRLMTIKGFFDSKKGSEASFKGSDTDTSFPAPQIEFSPVLQTVVEILQILQDLQGEKYGGALKKGLKLAMSNSPDSWEYKFEASKEIPVVKFPIPDEVYNSPETPLKLEASMKVGVYFNAALKVTTDPKKLLPTAGAYLDFYGRLSVMCVSLAAATVYAVGQVNLGIAADTKVGPSLTMKFGFGAQIVVGLPVVGNVSVLYMMGVEIYADSTQLNVSASLLFQGHAELLGGLVGITITIEAKGTVKRIGNRTDCAAQVTFAIEISIFLVIDIDFSTSWEEQRQIA